jgi:photosystem II stability/assembly factor-like uncharacterized protein
MVNLITFTKLTNYNFIMSKSTFILGVFLLSFLGIESQEYQNMINSGQFTVQQIQESAEAYFENRDKGRGTGYKGYKRWEYDALRMQDDNGFLKSPSFYYNELERYNSYKNSEAQLGQMRRVANWEQLGPSYWNQTSGWNPGVGRITSIAIDPNDEDHIIIGSPGGGVWKTTDGSTNWTALTDNLSNIQVYALTIHPNDSNTYFWGTSYGVIYKSTDAGATWNLLAYAGSGRINKILIDPTNTNKMFCSGEYDGIYKSVDAGQTWALIHPESSTGYDVEFKPGDTNTIYASGNSFFKSTDGGASFGIIQADVSLISWTQEYVSGSTDWIKASSNENNSITPKSGNVLAIFYQPDFSKPITKLISPQLDLSACTTPELKFSYSSVNWEGDIDELKVFYKTAINETWVELAHYTSEITSWEDIVISLPNPTADYYIALEGKSNYARGLTLDDVSVEDSTLGIIFSDNFDDESLTNNFGSGPKMIGVSADNPEVVYVLEADGGIFEGFYKSTDSGANFMALDHTGKNYFGYSSNADDDRGQAPRDMDIIVNPSDSEDVHIAGILSWRSTNGGTDFNVTSQWVPQNAVNQNIGYCHADIDLMIYHNDKIYVGSDGGIFVANDPLNVSSTYYTDLTTGLGIRQFYKIGISQTDPVIVSGGSQDNGTSVYRADGIWYDWLGADGMETFIDHSNPNTMYGTSQNGSLYKSFDQGATRFGLSTPDGKSGNWVTPFEQDPNDANTIYSGYDQIYKSTNGGQSLISGEQSWVPISQNFDGNANHLKIAPSNTNVMYAAYGENLYKTTNGGSIGDWVQLTGFSGNINSIALHPTDPNKLAIATNSSGKVYISSDGGLNWSVATHDLPNFSALALVWDTTYEEDILYLGMNYGMYYLRNNDTSWTSYDTGLPNVQIRELEINTADNKLYVATYGRGLWRVNLFNPEALGVNDLQTSDLTLSPNPSTGTFKLNWQLNTFVTIKIYDPLGKLVFYEKNRNLSQNPEIELQAPQGLYFLKVNTSNQEITKKLIIN